MYTKKIEIQLVVFERDRRKLGSTNRRSLMFLIPQYVSVVPPESNLCHHKRFMVNVDGALSEYKEEAMASMAPGKK